MSQTITAEDIKQEIIKLLDCDNADQAKEIIKYFDFAGAFCLVYYLEEELQKKQM